MGIEYINQPDRPKKPQHFSRGHVSTCSSAQVTRMHLRGDG